MEQNRFIQRNKEKILRRDTLRISAAVTRRCKSVKILIQEKISLAEIFYRIEMVSTNN